MGPSPTRTTPERSGLLLRGRRFIKSKTRANAASSVWWPGISQGITKVDQNCAKCEKYHRESIESMKGTEFPDQAWSRVGVDFFQHKDKHYFLAVDYF